MGAKGVKLGKNVLITWRRGGFQDWLVDEERLRKLDRVREFALRVVKQSEGAVVQEAGLQVAAAQIYELLMEFDPEVLKEQMKKGDADGYTRLVKVMTRLGDGGLKYEKYREEVSAKKAEMLQELEQAKKGGLTRERLERIERNLNLL